jgi:TolB protein
MKYKYPLLLAAFGALIGSGAALLFGQADIITTIMGAGGKPALAVTDFRGSGTQQFMNVFNQTLYSDLQSSGLFDMRAKSMFPLNNPQRPEDIRPSDNNQGFALVDWASNPVSASHLVFGYTAALNGSLVLYGNVDDTRQTDAAAASLMAQRYVGSLDESGATKVAHEFASDIIQKFGGSGSLLGSRIYFVSDRGLPAQQSEIWSMDWDGQNQTRLTTLGSQSIMPAISADGEKLAFTTYKEGQPKIYLTDTQTKRRLPFYNQDASLNATASFSPDGKSIYYASTAAAGDAQIYVAGIDGKGFRRVSYRQSIEMEPKVNPKNPGQLLMIAGPGHPQLYQMSSEGTSPDRVTNGEGEVANPAWHQDGQHIAFSWTSGIARGDWNVFVMDVGSRQYVQLTHNEGKNENPVWAPDGRHLVFGSTRSGKSQIYTMLADGTQVKQLTFQGTNKTPVWGTR